MNDEEHKVDEEELLFVQPAFNKYGADLVPLEKVTHYWWLSFADGNLPEGQQFLGAAIVPGIDIGTATAAAHSLGVNPGGEVRGAPIEVDMKLISKEWWCRLLSRDQCDLFFRQLKARREAEYGIG